MKAALGMASRFTALRPAPRRQQHGNPVRSFGVRRATAQDFSDTPTFRRGWLRSYSSALDRRPWLATKSLSGSWPFEQITSGMF